MWKYLTGGVKVSPLDNCVPVQVSPLAELVYSMLPRPKITEILDEVNSWTTFTRHFSHIKNDITRPDTPPAPHHHPCGWHQSWSDQNGGSLSRKHQIITGRYPGMVHPRRNLFSRPRRAGKRAGEKTTGGILGRRDNVIIRRTKFQNRQLWPLRRAG